MRPRLEKLKSLTQMSFGQSSSIDKWLFFSPVQRDYYKKVGDGSASSIVTAPLQWIGRNFPESPPALWQNMPDSGEEERVTGMGYLGGDHPMLELLSRPNEFYSGVILWQATIIDYNLSGNGYWLKIRDRGGRPIQLWWTPSSLMTPKGNETTFIDHYDYRPGTETIRVETEDVVHFRYSLDPIDPRKGRSPLSALLHEVFTDDEAGEFTASLLKNMGVPGIVVSPAKGSESASTDDLKATKEYLKGGFTGSKRGEPLVMSGPTAVAQFGFNPQQMTLREIRRIPEERVSAALGVPAIVAGLGAGLDRSTFSNYAEAREAAYQDNIIPAQRIVSEDVKHQLLRDFQPDDLHAYRFGFDLSNVRVLQEDRNALATRFDVGIRGGWIRVAEGRRAMDLEVDDTDEIYLRSTTVVEQPAGEPAPVPAQLSPGSEPAQLLPGEPPPDAEVVPTSGRKVKATRTQSRLAISLMRDQHSLSAVFAIELESDFIAMGVDCAETFLHMASQSSRQNGHGEKMLDAEKLARLIVATLINSFEEKFTKRYQNNTQRILDQTLETLSSSVNLTGGVSEVAQQELLKAGGMRVGLLDLGQVTKDSIFHAIDHGNQEGMNPRVIARSIREEVPAGKFINAGPAYRAQLISRTETRWVQNRATLTAYREAEDVSKCVAMDGGDDPECAERNGQEFTFDEAEAEMENEHPNGTLAFAPVVADSVPV